MNKGDASSRRDRANAKREKPRFSWRNFLLVLGPGVVAMLADTDAGSLITAAQSGANWGYRLLPFQVILIPILYIVQELTLRIGAVTGRSHGALIKERYGRGWAALAICTLMLACIGALLTEFGGFSGVGEMFGVPSWVTMILAVLALGIVAVTGSYSSVEKIAMAAGAFEVAFIAVAVWAHPSWSQLTKQIFALPLGNSQYLYLVSANIGAVVMPWMVFYQQSSVVEKGLTADDIPEARLETAIGAVVTQIVMSSVLIAAATALQHAHHSSLQTVQSIADALTPVLGPTFGRIVFGLGIVGAAFVAAIVVTLTAARALGELLGYEHKLDAKVGDAPWFYAAYAFVLVASAIFIVSGVNVVSLAVGVQVMNALLLTIVLGFLYLLARGLEGRYRLRGIYAVVAGFTMVVTIALGLYSGISGLL